MFLFDLFDNSIISLSRFAAAKLNKKIGITHCNTDFSYVLGFLLLYLPNIIGFE